MARQTRSQRRARRAESADAVERRPAPRPAAPAPSDDGDRGRPPQRPERPVAREGRDPFRFFHESWGELRKVEWPTQHQVVTGTTVVLIACIIVGAYLWANDLVWKHFVQNVLLK